MDLYAELQQLIRELDISVKSLRTTGTAYAEAERNYKITLREEVLKLRDEKVAIGLIDKTCYGIPRVAEARFKRDVAQTVYEANKDSVQAIKLKIKIVEGQLDREYRG